MSLEVDFDYEADSIANSRQHDEEEYSEECEYSSDCNDEQQESDDEEDLLDESEESSDDENLWMMYAVTMLAKDQSPELPLILSILDSTDDDDDDSVAEFQLATTIARQRGRQAQQSYSD